MRPKVTLEILSGLAVITLLAVLAPKVMAISSSQLEPQDSLGFAQAFVSSLTTPTKPSAPLPEDLELHAALVEDATRMYYTSVAKGRSKIVEAIYTFSQGFDRDLLFALALHESEFNPRATNYNYDGEGNVKSVDRGVFQLNSLSYPQLTEDDFFNVEINTKNGINHIRTAVVSNEGDIRKGLYEYNSGSSDSPPKRTLRYAKDVLAKYEMIKVQREVFVETHLAEIAAATGKSLVMRAAIKGPAVY